jgi:hypothetical protein
MEAKLRGALDKVLACVAPFMVEPPSCILGADGDTSEECMGSHIQLEFVHYRSVDMKTHECITVEGYAYREVVAEIANALGIAAECHKFHHNSMYPYKCVTLFLVFSMLLFMLCWQYNAVVTQRLKMSELNVFDVLSDRTCHLSA